MGFAYALLATLLFGLYIVPRQYTNVPLRVFLLWMGLGILVTSVAIGFAAEGVPRTDLTNYALMFAAGLVWSAGVTCYTMSVRYLGLSRAAPVKNTNGAFATLFGIVIFQEFTIAEPAALALAVTGSLAVVTAAVLLGRVHSSDARACPPIDHRCLRTGTALAVGAALGYSVRSIPLKIVLAEGVSPYTFLFYMAHGSFVGNALAALIFRREQSAHTPTWRDYSLAALSGVTWAAGSALLNLAVATIGIAVAFPIANLNTLVAVGFGLFVLRDIDLAGRKGSFAAGLAASVVGAALLAEALRVR